MPSSVGTDIETAAAFSAALDDFMRAMRRAKGRLGADAELSLSQYPLLEPLLDSAEPMGVRALACAAAVSPPTVTRMLVGLVRDGLVGGAPSAADRRVVHVALTDLGRERVLRKRANIEARRRQIFESLTEGERREAARLLAGLAAAIAAFATWRFVPESPVRVSARIDWLGGALMSVALLALLLAVSEGNAWGWTSGRVLGLFAAAAVLGVAWGRWEWRIVG